MEAMKINANHDSTYTVDNAMGMLLSKLDVAINDVEMGRVLTEEEFWAEIDEE